jgi:dienelactone hydrolase
MRFAIIFFLLFSNFAIAEPIYHEKKYPKGDGSFPAVILLHTSGGYKSDAYINDRGEFFLKEGFVIYAPDFFKRHGITPKTRLKTFTQFRKNIEQELLEIVELVKKDPKVNPNNVFAVGFSNGGFWATYLSSTGKINAASSHYGVWQFGGPKNLTKGYPVKYIKKECSPLLVLHPEKDVVQKYKFVKPEIDRVKKRCKDIKVHIYDKGGHNWGSSRYKGGVGYNPDIYKDAMKRTIVFFKSNLK